jgi:arsenate reductase (thioredoxin)
MLIMDYDVYLRHNFIILIFYRICKLMGVMKILILCTGNSCRSQMAHGFLQSFDGRLKVCSAGTDPAQQVNPKAVEVMLEAGIEIGNHQPQKVDQYLAEVWDYVITVCDDANETCPVFTGQVNQRIHLGFEDPSHALGSEEFIINEFKRIRDSIRDTFYSFYLQNILPQL